MAASQVETARAIEIAMTPRCHVQGEVEHLFKTRDQQIERHQLQGRIDDIDVQALDRTGRCKVAGEHWMICTAKAKQVLLNDAHHFVRSCAGLSQRAEHAALSERCKSQDGK